MEILINRRGDAASGKRRGLKAKNSGETILKRELTAIADLWKGQKRPSGSFRRLNDYASRQPPKISEFEKSERRF